jgi:hypothetical protein
MTSRNQLGPLDREPRPLIDHLCGSAQSTERSAVLQRIAGTLSELNHGLSIFRHPRLVGRAAGRGDL